MPSIKIYTTKIRSILVVTLLLAGFFHTQMTGQISDPIPDKIEPADFTLILEDFVQLPGGNASPRARVNMLREVNDGSGRLFACDLNGLLYTVEEGSWDLYFNLRGEFDEFIAAPGKGTGFGCFAFHPEFAENGIFYTSHAESAGSGTADFTPVEFDNIALQWVVYEWTAFDPGAARFEGTGRELLRMDFPDVLHGIQEIAFNPTSEEGDEDYGLLYICIGDGGSSKNFQKGNLQTAQSYLGSIFRIDPLGDNSANGAYGIPESNPNVHDEDAVRERYCYGFRNPHRISWDLGGEHMMLIGDIGEMNIEEVNIGMKGHNYGWSEREGTFYYDRSVGREFVFPLPDDDSLFNYTYPVSMYDHDEGYAIVGGYIYRGTGIPELDGKYLFGDIVNGRTFVVNADELEQGSHTQPKELFLTDENGNVIDLRQLGNDNRADLRFGRDLSGNIYILTKTDGYVRTLRSPSVSGTERIEHNTLRVNVSPNPASKELRWNTGEALADRIILFNSTGQVVYAGEPNGSNGAVDISALPGGIYTLTIESKNLTGIRKVSIIQ